ncbi:hypothetical protein Pr1d_06490 [Bythopirellula goksoeyrii]|uniref:Uncharacterized protein n=1 Tax=Bythopirellula goksoeyrii TaxID=1400387 RepID=A0A5B9Q2Y0_9BACT|nr:hypothetical protein Pr1d_06490 [Bythopirellula goksoeyrii]
MTGRRPCFTVAYGIAIDSFRGVASDSGRILTPWEHCVTMDDYPFQSTLFGTDYAGKYQDLPSKKD